MKILKETAQMRQEEQMASDAVSETSVSSDPRGLWIFIISVSIALLSFPLLVWFLPLGIFIFLMAEGAFIYQGMRQVEVAHLGALIYAGRRVRLSDGTTLFLREGWNFLPFFGLLFSYSDLDAHTVNLDVKPNPDEPVRTRKDKAPLLVHVELAYDPNPEYLIEYENIGEKEQVIKSLQGVSEGIIREFAIGPNEPNTWEKAVEMKHELLEFLVSELSKKAEIKNSGKENPRVPSEQEINNLQVGKGELEMPQFGIILRRANVKNVDLPKGKLRDAVEQVSVEDQERLSERKNAETFRRNMSLLTTIPAQIDEKGEPVGTETKPALTATESKDVLQTEKPGGNVKKNINVTVHDVSPTMERVIKEIAPLFADTLAKFFGKKEGNA